jgi:hypothetical protein
MMDEVVISLRNSKGAPVPVKFRFLLALLKEFSFMIEPFACHPSMRD